MQMVKLGKIIFKKLEDSDLDKLKVFCDSCKKLGYINNSNFENIKLNQMRMPYGQFFVGIDTEKDIIFNLAGVHQLPEVSPNAWRCLFRGAQLPGYGISKFLSKNMLKTGYQLSYVLAMQINFIKKQYPNSEFFISTNIENIQGMKSARMGNFIINTLNKTGVLSKHLNLKLYNTEQIVWKINEKVYWKERKKALGINFI